MESQSTNKKLSVVMFSGGRGTGALTEALLRYPDIKLSLLVNAYDDGLSTGLLRRFIPGMLGPSDVRKNLSRFLEPKKDQTSETLRFLMEYRFPETATATEALAVMDAFIHYPNNNIRHELLAKKELLPLSQLRILSQYLEAFVHFYNEKRETFSEGFPFGDMSFGNLIFAGAYLKNDQDFNRTIVDLSAFLGVATDAVINLTEGENLILTALKEDGRYLHDEASVVGPQDASKIAEIFLLPRFVKADSLGQYQIDNIRYLRNIETLPHINPQAEKLLREADIIIYGPGTQYSSLFPSYLTSGVAEAILANTGAEKVFIGNIAKDHDILAEDANSLVKAFLFNMGRKVEGAVRCQDLVTRFFFQKPEITDGEDSYVSFDADAFAYPLEKVSWIDLEGEKGKHSGSRTITELLLIIEGRLRKKIRHVSQKVSIIVPALNEEKTIGEVIRSLQEVEFSGLSLEKEIIVIDGCSSDTTYAIAEKMDVRTYQTRRGGGRGEALRLGIEKAKGDLIVFFPSDGEYEVRDIARLITPLIDQEFPVVFGSRAFRDTRDLTGTLKRVYGSDKLRYMLSKYGGMLLSTLMLFLYHRFLSDPLTSMKAFNARVFRDMTFSLRGVDFDMELIAKLVRTEHVILELPVSYNARTIQEGKKITIFDGILCLVALLRFCTWSPLKKKKTHYAKSLHHHSSV